MWKRVAAGAGEGRLVDAATGVEAGMGLGVGARPGGLGRCLHSLPRADAVCTPSHRCLGLGPHDDRAVCGVEHLLLLPPWLVPLVEGDGKGR